jgi:hypothetical protein
MSCDRYQYDADRLISSIENALADGNPSPAHASGST